MERKLVSIVVPVYNMERYLHHCLDSLIAQTYPFVEILLIDDGSTDSSGTICDQYATNFPQITVYHRENGGVSSARNFGIQMAKGDYLIFVDADDCIHRQMVEVYLENITKDRVLLCRISGDSNALKEAVNPKDTNLWGLSFTLDNFMDFFFYDHVNSPCDKLYDTRILQEHQISFPEDMDLGEDLFFNLKYFVFAPRKYQVFSVPLYFYRNERQDSLSRCFRLNLFELQKLMFDKLQIFLKHMDIFSGKNKKSYYQIYWNRLYLTISIYWNYFKDHSDQKVAKKIESILQESIWKEVWNHCKKENVITWKMRIKKRVLKYYGKKIKCLSRKQ